MAVTELWQPGQSEQPGGGGKVISLGIHPLCVCVTKKTFLDRISLWLPRLECSSMISGHCPQLTASI